MTPPTRPGFRIDLYNPDRFIVRCTECGEIAFVKRRHVAHKQADEHGLDCASTGVRPLAFHPEEIQLPAIGDQAAVIYRDETGEFGQVTGEVAGKTFLDRRLEQVTVALEIDEPGTSRDITVEYDPTGRHKRIVKSTDSQSRRHLGVFWTLQTPAVTVHWRPDETPTTAPEPTERDRDQRVATDGGVSQEGWQAQRTSVCQFCGKHVSEQFARVFGDQDDRVHRCLGCDSKRRIQLGSAAGIELSCPDPQNQPNRNRGYRAENRAIEQRQQHHYVADGGIQQEDSGSTFQSLQEDDQITVEYTPHRAEEPEELIGTVRSVSATRIGFETETDRYYVTPTGGLYRLRNAERSLWEYLTGDAEVV